MPNKLEYITGECFDYTGMILEICYTDGTNEKLYFTTTFLICYVLSCPRRNSQPNRDDCFFSFSSYEHGAFSGVFGSEKVWGITWKVYIKKVRGMLPALCQIL